LGWWLVFGGSRVEGVSINKALSGGIHRDNSLIRNNPLLVLYSRTI